MDSEKQLEGFVGAGMGGWLSLVVGFKEGTYCMEHWVWCINNEFWNTHISPNPHPRRKCRLVNGRTEI